MKKLLIGIISLALAVSMSITAFAAENNATNDGTSGTDITVNGKYRAGTTAEVVSVDLVWENMDFTYTGSSKGIWKPESHTYENATAGGWAATNGTDPKITVTNHSNTGIEADLTFSTDIAGLNGNFTNNLLVLDSAEGTELANAPKGETYFSVSGSGIDADKALGTITVTVEKKDPEAMYKVSESVFANLMETSNNFTLTGVNGEESMVIYFGGRSVMTDAFGNYNEVRTFDGTNYYRYTKERKDSDWHKEEIEKSDYDEIWQLANILWYLKDRYANFAYDSATHTYKSTGAFKVSEFETVTEATVGFENGALKSASMTTKDETVYTYSECGTTVVEIPTDIH